MQWRTQELFSGGFTPGIFSGGLHQEFFQGEGGSTNAVEDRGQTERGSGGR
jgi:hypothetical protein